MVSIFVTCISQKGLKLPRSLFIIIITIIITIIYPLTARVIGAPQIIGQPVSSIFPCSPLPSRTWRTPGLSIPRCCLPTSSSVCLVCFPLHKGRSGMSDVSPPVWNLTAVFFLFFFFLFWHFYSRNVVIGSTLLSPLLFFCQHLSLSLSYLFLLFAHSPDFFPQKFFNVSLRDRLFCMAPV